jgi:DNA repair exonuclease SbcCD ATPase subunit
MFKINNLTMRNFMSIGNVTQAVSFDNQQLTLVLGENLDLGGDDAGARNGVGKTTILNGLSYALYGTALTRIKKDNLINKSNGKNMMVTVEFERNGQIYHIERGRRKNVLRFYCGDDELSVDDEAQGDSRETQKTVEAAFGMSHDMFKHIVALNTYTEPFLSLNNANQRAIIEQLLGITLLSEKAENLKEINRETKRVITAIEARITADIDANKRIQKQIDNLERRQRLWKQTNTKEADEIREAIETLNELDVDGEIMLHADLAKWNQNEAESAQYETIIDDKARLIKQQERVLKNLVSDLETLADKKCHTCGQAFHGDQHEKTVATKEKLQTKTEQLLEDLNKEVVDAEAASLSLEDLGGKPETFYEELEDAYNHRNSIINLEEQLRNKVAEIDPYIEQIDSMKSEALKEIDYSELNEYGQMRDHQDFLYKLLTNKDSFIRKRIIEQNLAHLNARLGHYLEEMGLPHQVKFLNDLSVEITELGRDLDFDNLSRGERNRLILSLSWAFRDVWEALYQPINLMFIDELIDSGLDSKGVDAALSVLKKMSRERSKSIWLVSHRDELISRVGSILKVQKENGFTNFAQDE